MNVDGSRQSGEEDAITKSMCKCLQMAAANIKCHQLPGSPGLNKKQKWRSKQFNCSKSLHRMKSVNTVSKPSPNSYAGLTVARIATPRPISTTLVLCPHCYRTISNNQEVAVGQQHGFRGVTGGCQSEMGPSSDGFKDLGDRHISQL